jgi:Ca-activated chloride channel family protein
MKWADPGLLVLILLLPLLPLIAYWRMKSGFKKLSTLFRLQLISLWKDNLSLPHRYTKWTLRVLVLLFLILTLARPQIGESQQAIKAEGFEIFLALDVSESMLAEDLLPSRLEKAKIDLSRLVDQLGGHKIGILAFAGSAAVISPLTQDVAAVKMYLESLDTQTISTQGTRFESALEAADSAFERGSANTDTLSGITKVLLIASDGEDHEKGALEKAKKLTEKGIRIFSVAYGTEKGGSIPQRDVRGFLRGYKKDNSGNPVITTVKGDALRALAKEGQGFFTFATTDSAFIKDLGNQLDQLKKAQFETQMQVQYDEQFQIPLLIALLLGLIEIVITDIKRKKGVGQS